MAVCKKCKEEFTTLKETQEYCPACKIKEREMKPEEIQDRHLPEKQKRFTSE